MSSRSSYGSSYAQDKGAYAPRTSSPRSSTSTQSSGSSSSLYANSGQSSRNYRYGNKPPVVTQGGQSNDPNTSTSAPNSGYYN